MSPTHPCCNSTVIDFAAYRATREAPDGTAGTGVCLPDLERRGALSARAVAHRARMLAHLGGTTADGGSGSKRVASSPAVRLPRSAITQAVVLSAGRAGPDAVHGL